MTLLENKNTNEITIDLKKLLYTVWDKAVAIIAIAIVAAFIGYFIALLFVTPAYSAYADMIVNNSSATAENSISSSDITASSSLANTYSVILKSHTALEKVIAELGLNYSYDEIESHINVSVIEDTQIIRITVSDKDLNTAKAIAYKISLLAPEIISETVTVGSVKIIDSAWVSDKPTSPNKVKYAAVFGFVAMLLSVAVVVLRETLNDSIVDPDDIKKIFNAPLLGVIPVDPNDKNNNRNSKKRLHLAIESKSFPYVEAYKSLRNNLDYLSHDEGSLTKSFVVTSCNASEGKTTFSLNLALSLAEIGKKVIIVDCDLRKGSLQRYLRIPLSVPGVTSYIDGSSEMKDTILHNQKYNFDVLLCGVIPQNPSELINSRKFAEMIAGLSDTYDYVICDAAPVNAVSDTIVLSRYVDGVIMVIGQNQTTKESLQYAYEQLKQCNAPIFGTVLNWYEIPKGKGKGYSYSYYSYSNEEKPYGGGDQQKKKKGAKGAHR